MRTTVVGARATRKYIAAGRGQSGARYAPGMQLQTARLSWALAAALALAYAIVFAWVSPPAFQDFPNHLARAVVMDDVLLHAGRHFGDIFSAQLSFLPYLSGDLLWMALLQFCGVNASSAIMTLVVLFAVPAACDACARRFRLAPHDRALFLVMNLYLATCGCFLWGFIAYSFAVALVLILYVLAEGFRDTGSAGRLASYLAVLMLGYLTHLTVLVFAIAALGVSGLFRLRYRSTTFVREALLLLPAGALFVTAQLVSGHFTAPGDVSLGPYVWGGVGEKFRNLLWPFLRYDAVLDVGLFCGLAVCAAIVVAARKAGRPDLASRELASRELADPLDRRAALATALAGSFLLLYALLPDRYADAEHVDVRALPLAGNFLLLALFTTRGGAMQRSVPGHIALGIAALVAVVNLADLGLRQHRLAQWVDGYREAVAQVPARAWVLPISTRTRKGQLRPEVHAHGFLVADRGALEPYLFSADQGHPMKFFRYRARPYAPDLTWYSDPRDATPDWARIACEYRYILITRPFDAGRVGVQTRVRFENAVASLLEINRGSDCPHQVASPTSAAVEQ